MNLSEKVHLGRFNPKIKETQSKIYKFRERTYSEGRPGSEISSEKKVCFKCKKGEDENGKRR